MYAWIVGNPLLKALAAAVDWDGAIAQGLNALTSHLLYRSLWFYQGLAGIEIRGL